jgi:hypothetical protein
MYTYTYSRDSNDTVIKVFTLNSVKFLMKLYRRLKNSIIIDLRLNLIIK